MDLPDDAQVIPPGSVVVIRGLDNSSMMEFQQALRASTEWNGDHLFLFVPDDCDITALSTEDMAMAGWVRTDDPHSGLDGTAVVD